MKKHLSTIILVFVFLIGLSLLLYPTVSNYWNSRHQTRAIATYISDVAALDDDTYETVWESARAYNEALARKGIHWVLTEEELKDYEKQLNVSGSGIIGYIEIKKMNCSLPIYHGTDEAVLQIGVGHLEGSSLPVGGKSTHAVISGHRGLPSARLFTNLDQLEIGDTFTLKVLDEVLTYEVDQILIVDPGDLSALTIEEGKDYCTLVTCTPYGINTHRLLVRGHRTDTVGDTLSARVTADAVQIEPMIVAPLVAVPILLLLLIILLVRTRGTQSRKGGKRRKIK